MLNKKLVSTIIVAALFSVFLVIPSPTQAPEASAAQSDYYLKIEGIDGESSVDGHAGVIEINSWSWGASNAGVYTPRDVATGQSSGKRQHSPVTFSKRIDKSSPLLMKAAASGEHIKSAKLVVRKSAKDSNFYVITLSDILVSSYQSSAAGGNLPDDTFELDYAKIQIRHPDGTVVCLDAASMPCR